MAFPSRDFVHIHIPRMMLSAGEIRTKNVVYTCIERRETSQLRANHLFPLFSYTMTSGVHEAVPATNDLDNDAISNPNYPDGENLIC